MPKRFRYPWAHVDGLEGLGALTEDRADRGVAEVVVLRVLHGRVVQGLGARRQRALLLERADQALLAGEELGQLVRLLRVLALRRDGEVRATPVAALARDIRDVPLALGAGAGVLRDDAGHPRRAGDRRELGLLEGGGPLRAPLAVLAGQLGVDDLRGLVERGLDRRVRVDDQVVG